MDLPIPLPPVEIRRADSRLRDDDGYFVESGLQDVRMLTDAGLRTGAHMVDLGCGPGRLAIGLIVSGWSGSYLGVEVEESQVRWASSEITPQFPDFKFVRVDAASARYNPKGSAARTLPVDDGSADMVCALSVFSHMLPEEIGGYLGEVRRVLESEDGRALVTVFMEDNVPDVTENPPWLGDWRGRLHCVLYSTEFLGNLIEQAGLTLEEVFPPVEFRRQKSLVLRTL
jgi:SAM-dependent methyltransferase